MVILLLATKQEASFEACLVSYEILVGNINNNIFHQIISGMSDMLCNGMLCKNCLVAKPKEDLLYTEKRFLLFATPKSTRLTY